MMLDDRFDDLLRDAARDYNDPPETPKEEMWAAITAEKAKMAETEPRILSFRSFRLAAGIAALLALGVGLGRLTVKRVKSVPVPAQVAVDAPRNRGTAYQIATTEHLSQSEAFLTLFRASVTSGGDERLASATARQLLATNRLLLDSPAATDAKTRVLLQDLELVLAEIAQLSPQARSRDLDLINEGLGRDGVLSRLRAAVPAGASSIQGAL
jgi:hypothetical protein